MSGRLRKLFKDHEVLSALVISNGDYSNAAAMLTEYGRGEVSRQLAAYWATQFEHHKKNGEHYITSVVADRVLKNLTPIRSPSLEDDGEVPFEYNSWCILYIGDTHAPYHHHDTLEFLADVQDKYLPTMVVHGGDEVDYHALSFHDADPNLDAAGQELEEAKRFIRGLEQMFPYMTLLHSNHGSLVYRRALKHGIPTQCIKTYREILLPNTGGGWNWTDTFRITLPNGDAVQFQHEAAGDAITTAGHERCNLVLGHYHSKYSIKYAASKASLYWAVNGGCLIDNSSLAFAYGKTTKLKPIVGCVVIQDSIPSLVPMPLNEKGRYVGHL